MKLVGFILILYFDGDRRSFMIIFRFWKKYWEFIFFYKRFCISGLTTVQSICCRIFVKSKGVILIEK